jgi:16S rRNA (adenine1518-N6/adenine1519-N6)-dimethyltransferase
MKLGQHFLIDRDVTERIVNYSELKPNDKVLEIGPGHGDLTLALADRVECVYAVEVDPYLAANLRGRIPNVNVINADALTVELPDYNKIVSNLPYQISSKITYRLLSRPFELAVLMFQREFSLRMQATVGSKEYGRLAMVVGFFCEVEILECVPKTAFRPVPSVNSSIVRLRPRKEKPEVDAMIFMRIVEGLFRSRRKKVKKALAAMGVTKEMLSGLEASTIEKRPEELAPDEVALLAGAINWFALKD